MKGTFLFLAILFINLNSEAQTPGGINYQGVARSQYLTTLNNDSLNLRFTVRENTPTGVVLYSESRGTRTDSFGVFHVVIGSGQTITQSGNIKQVKWSDTTKKFLQVEMDILDYNPPGYKDMGTTQLLSVPFSFYSDISDSSRISSKTDSAKYAKGSGSYFFSVSIPGDNYQFIPNNNNYTYVVQFPSVLENQGNVFDPVTSTFKAPEAGYYQFQFNASHLFDNNFPTNPSASYTAEATAILVKNATAINVLHEERHNFTAPSSFENYGLDYFTKQVVVKLAKDDVLSIRVNVSYTNFPNFKLGWNTADYAGQNIDIRMLCEFSGFRIK